MRVLFIASDIQALGGIQQYNRKFIANLKMLGHKVELIEIKGGYIAKLFTVTRALFRGIFVNPDIIICAHINYSPIGYFLKKVFRREYIVCTHGIDVWEIKSLAQRNAMRAAKVITTVAEFTRDKMVAQIPELEDKIYLLYNPVDGSRFVQKQKSAELIKKYGLEGNKVIFTIARLSALEGYKGYDRVIQAMPKILEKVPDAMYLLGGKGDDAPRVRKLIDAMNLRDKVIMVGFIPDEEIVDYYNLADVFTMPSKAEGAPAVYIEALSCGIPVIAGNRDGSATPLQEGKTGLLIDPEDINEIAKAIIDVLTKNIRPELLDREHLRKVTLEKFGIEKFPKRVSGVLQKFANA